MATENPPTCGPASPQPGAARHWEATAQVSTYSYVNLFHGNLLTAIPIVSWSGRGSGLNMMLYHNSASIADTSIPQAVGFDLGPGWSLSYSDHLLLDQLPNKVTVVRADGTRDVFSWHGASQGWSPPSGVYDTLVQIESDRWQLKHKDQSYHQFWSVGCQDGIARLERVVDAADNILSVSWDTCNPLLFDYEVRMEGVTDASNRILDLQFDATDRFWRFFDDRDEPGLPGPGEIADRYWTVGYVSSRISSLTGPRNHPINVSYDLDGRISTITDKHVPPTPPAVGPTWTYSYLDGRLSRVDDPAGQGGGLNQQFSFTCVVIDESRSAFRTTYTDRRSYSSVYSFVGPGTLGVAGNVDTLEWFDDPLGHRDWYEFDGSHNLVWYEDALFNTWTASYDSRGNILTRTDPFEHTETWEYDSYNNVTLHTDRGGNTVRYYYDLATAIPPRPTLLTRIVEPDDTANPPAGQQPGQEGAFPVTRLTYYGNGQLQDVTDPNGVWTGFDYDQWGQPLDYHEGKYQTSTASEVLVYTVHTVKNSGSWTTESSDSGSGVTAPQSSDADGNGTGLQCLISATAVAPQSGWFWFPPPCEAPGLDTRSAFYPITGQEVTYDPMGRPLEFPMVVDAESYFGRSIHQEYDVMGRATVVEVDSDELAPQGVTRTFSFTHAPASGRTTRVGPDGVATIVLRDPANRIQRVERWAPPVPPSTLSTLLMRADYTYEDNDALSRITFHNGATTEYHYFLHRLASITHKDAFGVEMMSLGYTYNDNDLPVVIFETGYQSGVSATTTFIYDRRNRLTRETRTMTPDDPALEYDLSYAYDAGGNRTQKIDYKNKRRTDYFYDWPNPQYYGSANNRLMKYTLWDTTLPKKPKLVSTTYYEYNGSGNVIRVITETPPGGGAQQSATGGTQELSSGTDQAALDGAVGIDALEASPEEGAGEPQAMAAVSNCPTESWTYDAVRFAYGENNRTVVFAHDEHWCWDPAVTQCPDATDQYTITWAREFRYDGARARYMDRQLNPTLLMQNQIAEVATTWSDYDGDEAYGDFEVIPGNPPTVNDLASYQPGLWRRSAGSSETLASDHVGTLRQTVDELTGTGTGLRLFTAFGEPIVSGGDRFGYVGDWGYQSHAETQYLHVGARYYDPGSGRFLQRDPIGIRGGRNVYSYANGRATASIDPEGLSGGGCRPIYRPPPIEEPPPPPPAGDPGNIDISVRVGPVGASGKARDWKALICWWGLSVLPLLVPPPPPPVPPLPLFPVLPAGPPPGAVW